MSSFTETFKCAEKIVRPLIEQHGFTLKSIEINDVKGSQWIYGSAIYKEQRNWLRAGSAQRFIKISVAPLRLELDLNFGAGKEEYTIYELHNLNGGGEFPTLQHSLYKAMEDEVALAAEFTTLIQLLVTCGPDFFNEKTSLFSDLKAQRRKYAIEEENKRIFKEAEAAFKKKQWSVVVNLLDKKEAYLSKLNASRLKYARKKINITHIRLRAVNKQK